MKKFLKSTWVWLNGKKRNIACLYWSVLVPTFQIVYPEGIPSGINKPFLIIGIILSAVGLGHATVKNYIEKNKVEVVNTCN
jgi:hypothetical protein